MNQLTPIDPQTNVQAYRASTEAATLCKEIVVQTAMNIQNRKYVKVEGWQAIAVAHGCTASARDVERVDGGVRAIGEIRRMSDGAIIATAEGFVGEDEPTWYGGEVKNNYGTKTLPKRPDYAIRAMAQTRAISRACRSAFAHVVVMMNAGLETTPAEEVPMGGFDNGAQAEPKIPGIHKIKERLRALQTAGDQCSLLEAFNEHVHSAKADLEQIKHNNHSWWTGDGEDFEGFKSWIVRRRAELAPELDDATFAMLVQEMKETETKPQLEAWIEKNIDQIAALDDADTRKFQQAKDWHESAINEMDKVQS